jgi:hypothetical protein
MLPLIFPITGDEQIPAQAPNGVTGKIRISDLAAYIKALP